MIKGMSFVLVFGAYHRCVWLCGLQLDGRLRGLVFTLICGECIDVVSSRAVDSGVGFRIGEETHRVLPCR